uniref:Uncharacterized protein n=1 Tax=Triticum urartu TaxID=4572 RepID=A0A8R7P6J0_TRIUA
MSSSTQFVTVSWLINATFLMCIVYISLVICTCLNHGNP